MLQVQSLATAYCRNGVPVPVFRDVSMQVRQGEFVSILGHSGCGKTTLLFCLAGLMRPDAGSVHWKGRPLQGAAPEMVLVFQDYVNSLFPWKTALDNVLFAMAHSPLSKSERRQAALEYLAAVGLADYAAYHPWELSGGMQQRLTIARALARGAEMLLMDEPFASLDAQTRGELEDLLLDIRAKHNKTVVFVTHDIEEAIYLSDRVLLMLGHPAELGQELVVDLPQPRNQLVTRALPEFLALRAQVYTLLAREDGA